MVLYILINYFCFFALIRSVFIRFVLKEKMINSHMMDFNLDNLYKVLNSLFIKKTPIENHILKFIYFIITPVIPAIFVWFLYR